MFSTRAANRSATRPRAAVTMAFASNHPVRKQPGCGRTHERSSKPGSTLGGLYVQPSLRPVDRAVDLQFHRVAQGAVAVRRRAEPQLAYPTVQVVDHAAPQG